MENDEDGMLIMINGIEFTLEEARLTFNELSKIFTNDNSKSSSNEKIINFNPPYYVEEQIKFDDNQQKFTPYCRSSDY